MPTAKSAGDTKSFGSGGKASWPLPPSSVFKCQPAIPWIDPKLFYMDHSLNPILHHNGMCVVGHVIPEDAEQEDQMSENEFYEFHRATHQKRVIRRTIEYSNNPERGIDLGKDAVQTRSNNNNNAKPTGILKKHAPPPPPIAATPPGTEMRKILRDNSVSVNSRSNSKSKKKWSPFQKDKTQSWKFFY